MLTKNFSHPLKLQTPEMDVWINKPFNLGRLQLKGTAQTEAAERVLYKRKVWKNSVSRYRYVMNLLISFTMRALSMAMWTQRELQSSKDVSFLREIKSKTKMSARLKKSWFVFFLSNLFKIKVTGLLQSKTECKETKFSLLLIFTSIEMFSLSQ